MGALVSSAAVIFVLVSEAANCHHCHLRRRGVKSKHPPRTRASNPGGRHPETIPPEQRLLPRASGPGNVVGEWSRRYTSDRPLPGSGNPPRAGGGSESAIGIQGR